MRINIRQIHVLLLSMILTAIAWPISVGRETSPEAAIMRQEHRNEYVQFEAVIDTLTLRRNDDSRYRLRPDTPLLFAENFVERGGLCHGYP